MKARSRQFTCWSHSRRIWVFLFLLLLLPVVHGCLASCQVISPDGSRARRKKKHGGEKKQKQSEHYIAEENEKEAIHYYTKHTHNRRG